MSLSELPDVALIRIFRTLDHLELARLYYSFHSSKRLQTLIENCSCLWQHIHIKSTVDYNLFTYFCRLLIFNASTIRQLTIDELDLTCQKILLENKFSLKDFTHLEQLIIHDQHFCHTLESVNFCSSTLKTLRLTNEHMKFQHLNQLNQLNTLQLTLYSIDILKVPLEYLTNLHLKLMFDHDHQPHRIFSQLPRHSLQILTLKFLILNNDFNFLNEFSAYLDSCFHLHTLELFYLHGMCPISIYTNINYSKYHRMILINISQLRQTKTFIEFNQYNLPMEYIQYNPILNLIQSSSNIQKQIWSGREVISIDYLQCVTTSMDLFSEMNVIWLDKNHGTQTFEAYILRSIYNASNIISSIRNLSISKFELSLSALLALMTKLPSVMDLIITDGIIDQMGSGILNIENVIKTNMNPSQSNIQTIVMNNIQLSRRTVVNICLNTQQLNSLIMNDVKIINRTINSGITLLTLFKQIAQITDQFKWNQLKSLTLGKNLLTRDNLYSFTPSTYAINLAHLCLIIQDQTLIDPHEQFLKTIKKLLKNYPSLTSFIIEFTNRYEGQFRLRNQLEILFQTNLNKKIYVYPTLHDRACRFCFASDFYTEEEDDDDRSTNEQYRTFCGIPLLKKQRKSNVLS